MSDYASCNAPILIMIKYEDFFDEMNILLPFENGLDETVEHLGILDMLLKAQAEEKLYIDGGYEEAGEGTLQSLDMVREEVHKGLRHISSRQSITAGLGRSLSVEGGMPLSVVSETFGLHDYLYLCLLLAIAPAFDETFSDKYLYLKDKGDRYAYPTFALAYRLYRYMSSQGQQVAAMKSRQIMEYSPAFRIIPCEDMGSELYDYFTVSRQIVPLLKGQDILPEHMSLYVREYPGGSIRPLIREREISELKILYQRPSDISGAAYAVEPRIINLTGKRGSGRKTLALNATDKNGILALHTKDLLSLKADEGYEGLLRDIIVRSRLLDLDILLDESDADDSMRQPLGLLLRELSLHMDRITILSETADSVREICHGYRYVNFRVDLPDYDESVALWTDKIYSGSVDAGKKDPDKKDSDKKDAGKKDSDKKDAGSITSAEIEMLSSRYILTPAGIEQVCTEARGISSMKGRALELSDIQEAVKAANTGRIEDLANRLRGPYGMDDLKLKDSELKVIKMLCARVNNRSRVESAWGFKDKRNYGRGTSLVLYGAPGTGKTMTAIVIANELGMDLYRVDLSQMVDKYVGETEKNLGRVFDAAAGGNFILFFDEADSLFSKRTEASSSNDKYANNEVSYLLQKMESYEGVSILATNRFNNFDNAFLRRLTYVLNLDLPDREGRLQIYRANIPAQAPVDGDLDLEFFADTFEISGSVIKSCIVNAAYLAADADEAIGNRHLARAIYTELKKTGSLVSASTLGKYAIYV